MATDTIPAMPPGPPERPAPTAASGSADSPAASWMASLIEPVPPARPTSESAAADSALDAAGQTAPGATSEAFHDVREAAEKDATGANRKAQGSIWKAWWLAGAQRWAKGGGTANKRLDVAKAQAQANQVKESRTTTVNKSDGFPSRGSSGGSGGSGKGAAGGGKGAPKTGPNTRGNSGSGTSGNSSGAAGRGSSGTPGGRSGSSGASGAGPKGSKGTGGAEKGDSKNGSGSGKQGPSANGTGKSGAKGGTGSGSNSNGKSATGTDKGRGSTGTGKATDAGKGGSQKGSDTKNGGSGKAGKNGASGKSAGGPGADGGKTSLAKGAASGAGANDPRSPLEKSREIGHGDGSKARRVVDHGKAYVDGVKDGWGDERDKNAKEHGRLDKAHDKTKPPGTSSTDKPSATGPKDDSKEDDDFMSKPTPIAVKGIDAKKITLGEGFLKGSMSRGELRNFKHYERRLDGRTDGLAKVVDATKTLAAQAREQAKDCQDLADEAKGVAGGEKLGIQLTKLAEQAKAQADEADEVHKRAQRSFDFGKAVLSNVQTRYAPLYKAVVDSDETKPAELRFYTDRTTDSALAA